MIKCLCAMLEQVCSLFVVKSAERERGGMMRKTAPTCRNHTAEGKEQDDYQECVSHRAGEVNTRDFQK